MSMLAERKQKATWFLCPRQNEWSKDANKYGQRMLEKMGWKPGSGLGANQQGMTDALRIKYKCDKKGLGAKEPKYDDIKQQRDFDQLLASLSEETTNTDTVENVKSLEEISKKAKKFVHYHKRITGKDLTRYSEKDLRCILGFGKEYDKELDNEIISNDKKELEKKVDNYLLCAESEDVTEEVQKKKKRKKSSKSLKDNVENLVLIDLKLENIVQKEGLEDEKVVENLGKSKKQKKSSKYSKVECNDQDLGEIVKENENGHDLHSDALANINLTNCVQDVEKPRKTKNRNKSSKCLELGCNNLNENNFLSDTEVKIVVETKPEDLDCVNQTEGEEVIDNPRKSKKRKKSLKCLEANLDNDLNENVVAQKDKEEVGNPRKSKKRKKPSKLLEIKCEESHENDSQDPTREKPAKKKKKHCT